MNAQLGFFNFTRDKSGRKYLQERLCQNGKQLQLLVEQAPISIAMLDRELRYLATSARWVREFGRGNKDLIGLSHYEVHPDISDEWKRVHREALAGAHLTHDADLWVQEDGSRHWLRWAVYPWIDDNDDIGGLVIYAENITALKLAEEQMLEKVLEALPVGIWLVNRDGDILLGNPAGRAIWHGANFAGAHPYGDFKAWRHETGEFVTPDQWALTRAIRNGESVAEETLDIECFDGSRKTIINSAMPLRSTDGQIIGAIAVNQDITEKLRMADSLRESEANLKSAQAISHLGSWSLDVRKNALAWSDESYRMFGIAKGAPLNYERFLAAVHPDDRAMVDREWKNALQGAPYDIEHRIVVGGQVRWIRERAELVWSESGQLTGGIGTCQDITERKAGELEQRRLAKMQAAILDVIPANIVLIDAAGTILSANREWMRQTENCAGITGNLSEGDNYLAACDAVRGPNVHDAEAIAIGIRNVIQGRCARYSRKYLYQGSGKRRWHQVVGVPFDADGQAGAVIMHLDVTESHLAEERLHEREEEFRALAENAPDIIARFDRQYRFLYVNPAIEAVIGLPTIAFTGRTHAEVGLPADIASLFQTAIEDVFVNGHDVVTEFTLSSTFGDRHYHCRMVPERNRSRSVETVLAVARDVTDSKIAELELSASRQMLRELAAENEMAREEERKYIAREIHDELGQTLTALRMDAQLLRMRFGANEPELAKKTRDMMLLVDRAIEGVRDVAARLRPAVLDMGVITAIEWLCSQFTLLTAVSCNLHVPEESIELDEGHKLTVFRIVQESLTNVTRHARASDVEITLGRDDADLRIEVRDDGIGFDSTVNSTGKTFGLLSMRERAIALGGTVHIVSSPGHGTTVSVRIPINT